MQKDGRVDAFGRMASSLQVLPGDELGLYKAIRDLLGPGHGLLDLVARTRLNESEVQAVSSLMMRGFQRKGVAKMLRSNRIDWEKLPYPLQMVVSFCTARISKDGLSRHEFVESFTGVMAPGPAAIGGRRRGRKDEEE